ncbi:hypothetical protein QTP88_018334 [Uroleucon formosanum]
MSKQRVFDIFNFTKPQPDKLTILNKPKLKSNSDNDSDSVDSELLALSNFSSSTSSLNETDYESTGYKNLLKNDEKIDLGDLQSGPIRPVLKSYPMTNFGNPKRCFNASYFNEHDWLEYSIQNDSLHYSLCRNFGAKDNEGTFSKTGFRNWKKLSGSRGITEKKQTKLKAHASTKSHLACVAKWLGHKNTETIGSVHTQLSTQHKLQVEANKSYIKTLIDITLYLSCQGLPFRGHDESTDSLNIGNFKEACQLMSKYIPEFSVKFLKTTNYTSPLVQNSIIEMCAKNVRDQIISEVGDGVFGIIFYKEEQMALCIRYCKGLDIFEKFIGFINCSESQNARSLCEYILKYLKEYGLNTNAKLVAQSYDGASVMSGRFNGVQALIKCIFIILFVLKESRNVFHTLESLYVHISQSARNKNLIDIQKNLGIEKKDFNTTENICNSFIHLFILQKVLTMINILSNQLQSKTATLGNAANVIKSVIKSFEDLRNPVAFSQMWREILQFCEDHNLTIEKPFQSCKRKRLQSKSLSSFVMSTTTKMVTSIDNFFKLDFELSTYFIDHYKDLLSISVDSLKAEMIVAKIVIIPTYGTSKELTTDNLKLILQENVYPNLFHLYKVAITLPISSSTYERSFSAMRRRKTWLRTSMLQDRFTQVSILYIEKSDTKNINKDIILKQFAEEHKYIMLT